jgi:transketolase
MLNEISAKIRKEILYISKESGHGHIPTGFSIVEMLISVYENMNHNADNPEWENRDIFLLSKGHASLAQYTTLANFGYFDKEELITYGSYNSRFGCHADRLKVPGVEASTGSLGHGIGLAVGIALGMKIRKEERSVYVLIGDGESNEGTVWESIMVAVDQSLDNLTILYDNNSSQKRCLMIDNPAERFEAFGAAVFSVDGHKIDEITNAINEQANKPKVIICNTVKGYGSKTLSEEMFAWHRRSPNDEEYQMLVKEVEDA